MRNLFIILLASITIFPSMVLVFAGGCLNIGQVMTPRSSNITLKATVVNQHYCKGIQPETDTLKVLLNFRFENTGSDAVILFKESSIITQVKIAASRDSLMSGPIEKIEDFHVQSWGASIDVDDEKFLDLFKVLKSGDILETTAWLTLTIPSNSSQIVSHIRSTGHHVFQVTVATWPLFADGDPEKPKSRWLNLGRLLFSEVTSQPTTLLINRNRTLGQCMDSVRLPASKSK